MTQLPPDDKPWQEFLREHCPPPPPAAEDLEEQIMNAIKKSEEPAISRRLWALPPAIAAGLLMVWSGYRTVVPFPEPSNSASLEALLEDNWNGVVGATPASLQSNSKQPDGKLLANTAR
jgi:hypothetical protein